MIELRRLRAFVTVVEEGNITRAAERLFIQQPPLTRLLQGLEDELGVTLLQRLPRGVRVTEAGGVLFEEARALLARAERLREAVQRAARGEQGAHRHRLHQLRRTTPVRAQPAAPLPRHPAGHHYPVGRSRQRRTDGGVAGTAPRRRLRALTGQRHSRPERGAGAQRTDDRRPCRWATGWRKKRSSRCRWPNWPTRRLFSIAARPARGCTTPSWPPATAPASARASCRKRRACRPPSAWSAPGWGCQWCPAQCGGWAATASSTAPLAEEAQLSAPLYLALRRSPASPIVERFLSAGAGDRGGVIKSPNGQ